ncbi:MAG: Holo-[acyl-carrier-protein] synthase [Actinobacteria bacterium 66_15]|nr:MAG: Holo-[acyl-carrier-protein] synthase [Actinobacteria bacterium 66_15]
MFDVRESILAVFPGVRARLPQHNPTVKDDPRAGAVTVRSLFREQVATCKVVRSTRDTGSRRRMSAEHRAITGLGVDIVEIARMRDALERRPRMKERLFSDEERAYCEGRNKPEIHYAMRFAAKEAVLKALGTGFSGMRFRDVEVVRDERGRPSPHLSGRAAEVAEAAGVVEVHLSLSFTHENAVASAVAITEDMRPKVEAEVETPQERLAASFKDARSFLDEVGNEQP